MRVEQILTDSAARHGHRAAIVAGRTAHSYAELDRKSDRLAAAFAARGVGRGGRVSVYLNAGFPAVVTAFAVLKAGATLCPADTASDADALARSLNARRATGIVTEARLALKAAGALCVVPTVKLVVLVGGERASAEGNCLSYEAAVGRLEGSVPAPAGSPDDAALLLCSVDGNGSYDVESFSHADVLAVASPAIVADEAVVPAPASVATSAGFCRLISAIRGGATQIIDGPVFGRAPTLVGADFRDVRLALA